MATDDVVLTFVTPREFQTRKLSATFDEAGEGRVAITPIRLQNEISSALCGYILVDLPGEDKRQTYELRVTQRNRMLVRPVGDSKPLRAPRRKKIDASGGTDG